MLLLSPCAGAGVQRPLQPTLDLLLEKELRLRTPPEELKLLWRAAGKGREGDQAAEERIKGEEEAAHSLSKDGDGSLKDKRSDGDGLREDQATMCGSGIGSRQQGGDGRDPGAEGGGEVVGVNAASDGEGMSVQDIPLPPL